VRHRPGPVLRAGRVGRRDGVGHPHQRIGPRHVPHPRTRIPLVLVRDVVGDLCGAGLLGGATRFAMEAVAGDLQRFLDDLALIGGETDPRPPGTVVVGPERHAPLTRHPRLGRVGIEVVLPRGGGDLVHRRVHRDLTHRRLELARRVPRDRRRLIERELPLHEQPDRDRQIRGASR